MKPPIFLIGNPRSGTTLLRLMLNNHANIVVPPECGFAVWWYERYKHWTKASVRDQPMFDRFLQDLSNSRKIETWNLDFTRLAEFICSMEPFDYSELVSSIYVFFGETVGRSFHRWGDKNNFHIQRVDTLNMMFPSASFIHIVRDGRDVACSYKSLAHMGINSQYAPTLPTDVPEIAAEWTSNLQSAVTSFEGVGWYRVHEVRYEDLVTETRKELEKVCRFLDEPYDDSMLDYYIENQKAHQEPTEFLQWKRKTLQKPTASEVGKYATQLAREEITEFESIAGEMLARYGYQ